MTSAHTERFRRLLRQELSAGALPGVSDQALVQRLAVGRDPVAFEAILRRHGPMVLSLCRRVLDNQHDAEDACQATFLVLIEKAASVRRQEAVGSWLYGVAYRVARKARSRAACRQDREMQAVPPTTCDPLAELTLREAQAILDRELGRLPDKLRAPLLLCCLEGLTRDEAALRLGWPLGKLKSRLEQARALLRSRLTARGLTPSAALMALLLRQQPASGALPASLVQAMATCISSSGVQARLVSAQAVSLAKGAMRTMFWTKAAFGAIGLLTVLAGVGAVAIVATSAWSGHDVPRIVTRADQPVGPPAPAAAQARGAKTDDVRQFQGNWLLVEFEFNGAKAPKEQVEALKVRWKVQGDKVTEHIRDKTREMKLTLDASKQPKSLSLTVVAGMGGEFFPGGTEKGAIVPGIYRIEADTLTICINAKGGKELPDEFKTQKDDPWVIYVLKRQSGKDAEESKAPRTDLPGELEVGRSKLRQLGLALATYVDDKGHMPPPAIRDKQGKALLSWRVALLPYLDESLKDLHDEFRLDEAWDSLHNKKLLEKMPHFYASPSRDPGKAHHTFYQVFTAENTAFPPGPGLNPKNIKGLEKTILIIEAHEAVPWTKPLDLPYEGGKPVPKLGGAFHSGFHMLAGYTQVYFNRRDFDLDLLRREIEVERADDQ
jgi:RNA polymerase sigma factor (sigma-70 family)